MTRKEEFEQMIDAIDKADTWDAYPDYWQKLCDWYDIDQSDIEKYYDPEILFNAVVAAYKKECGEGEAASPNSAKLKVFRLTDRHTISVRMIALTGIGSNTRTGSKKKKGAVMSRASLITR